ncbi:MAG: HEAT repeat domain-containing protein [Anaerolineae bacterium]|jgi:HEAT repeat protein|nr:HEAT repeat domain-containing protein [Anaerolineae bacterium]
MNAPADKAAQFGRTLDLLRDPDAPFTAEAIYSLSDLAGERLDALRARWPDMPASRRHRLITRLVETSETNFEYDFSAVIRLALDDPSTEVRRAAIDGVFEECPMTIVRRLIDMATGDPFSEVRAAAVGALGIFVLQGELGKLREPINTQIQDTVLALHDNLSESLDVRRRALEAIANCGRAGVQERIREAYYADDLPMRASAVFAMGRSCDERWAPQVLEELASDYPEMRYEAARAAGELELRRALPQLIELAYEDDRQIQEVAIWSLGEIGGSAARGALTELAALAEEVNDNELLDAIAEAQANATLADDDMLPLFDFSYYDDDLDEIEIDDMDDLDDDR